MKEDNAGLAEIFDASWTEISQLFIKETEETKGYIRDTARRRILKSAIKDTEGARAKKIIAGHIKDTADIAYYKNKKDTDPDLKQKILDILIVSHTSNK